MLISIAVASLLVAPRYEFPKDFVGKWKGPMRWSKPGPKPAQGVTMSLSILPTSEPNLFDYRLQYGDKNEDIRPYKLKLIDAVKGHWQVDEQNGIRLDDYWVDQALTGVFSVGESTIVSKLYREGKNLVSEMTTYSNKNTTSSGGGDVPSVLTYPILSIQRSVMKLQRS
jgi:hypothetical protein